MVQDQVAIEPSQSEEGLLIRDTVCSIQPIETVQVNHAPLKQREEYRQDPEPDVGVCN